MPENDIYDFRVTRLSLIFVILMGFWLPPVLAKQKYSEDTDKAVVTNPVTATADNHATADNPLELDKLTVTGQRSPLSIRRELFRTQDRIFEMFNDLNTDDDYDMVCVHEARIGSQIKYQNCKPRKLWSAESFAWADWIDGEPYDLGLSEAHRIEQRQRELMADEANRNPQFMELLKQRLALRKAYEAETGPQ